MDIFDLPSSSPNDSATSVSTVHVTSLISTESHQLGYRASAITDTTPRHETYGDGPLPESYTIPQFETIAVRDQGQRATCVAQSVRTIRESLALTHGTQVRLSMEYLYDKSQARDGAATPGITPFTCLSILATDGTPHEATLPDAVNDATVAAEQLQAVRTEASYFRATGYGLLTSLEAIKTVIAQNRPVLLGIRLHVNQLQALEAANCTGTIAVPDAHDSEIGGHAIVAYGYLTIGGTEYLQIRNSWGEHWGDNGNGLLPTIYPNLLADAWAVTV